MRSCSARTLPTAWHRGQCGFCCHWAAASLQLSAKLRLKLLLLQPQACQDTDPVCHVALTRLAGAKGKAVATKGKGAAAKGKGAAASKGAKAAAKKKTLSDVEKAALEEEEAAAISGEDCLPFK